jgi:uncharacterized SAM-binding protein YcdF (DUF218 family)
MGKSLLVAAVLIAYLGSIEPVGTLLLEPLEGRYSALDPSPALAAVGYIIVLGSDYTPRPGIPVSAALNDDGIQRLVAAVSLMRSLGTNSLVVSGGAQPGYTPSALGYAELAHELGIPDISITLSDRSLNTGAEAHAIQRLLGSQPFILVTSAYHMPRAMQLMKRAGAQAIPAPVGQYARTLDHLGWRSFLPTSRGLSNSERALHEYIGLAALAMGFE